MPNKNTLIQKIVNRICESDGANANLKIKRNERKKAEQAEDKAFKELQKANQKMQALWLELREEV